MPDAAPDAAFAPSPPRIAASPFDPGGASEVQPVKIVGLVMLGRDETWCLRLTLLAALAWCDALVIGMHEPLGPTMKVLGEFAAANPGRVTCTRFEGPWREMQWRQEILDLARRTYAPDICAVIDADETPTARSLLTLRAYAHRTCSLPSPAGALHFQQFPMICPHRDGPGGLVRLTLPKFSGKGIGLFFRDTPEATWRPQEDGYQFHRRTPYGYHDCPPLADAPIEVIHWQYATLDRLAIKAAWYKLTEAKLHPGRRTPEQLSELYDWAVNAIVNALAARRPLGEPMPAGWDDYESAVRAIAESRGGRPPVRTPETWTYGTPGRWADLIDLDAIPWQAARIPKLIADAPLADVPELTRTLRCWAASDAARAAVGMSPPIR